MSSFFKKLMATGAVLSMGIASGAFADSAYNYAYNQHNYRDGSCAQPCPSPCNPCGNWCENWSFNAAWLYWKVNGDEFDFGNEKFSDNDDGFVFESESYHDIKFDWDSGFRVGFGFDICSCNWGVDVEWTHFDSKSHKSFTVFGPNNGGNAVAVGFTPLDSGDPFPGSIYVDPDQSARVSGRLNFRYNVVDIELGKWLNCGCGCCILFRPHIGLRLADIHESFKDNLQFFNGAETLIGDTFIGNNVDNYDFHLKNRFKGVGPRVGFDLDLCICDGLSFIGKTAASLVWGNTHLTQHMFAESFTDDEVFSVIKEHYRHTRAITDLYFGLRYQTTACDCYPVVIEAAWEHHFLFSQHRFWVDDAFDNDSATTSWKKNGDLALQGWTLNFEFDF